MCLGILTHLPFPRLQVIDGYLRPMQTHDWDRALLSVYRSFPMGAPPPDLLRIRAPVLVIQVQARRGVERVVPLVNTPTCNRTCDRYGLVYPTTRRCSTRLCCVCVCVRVRVCVCVCVRVCVCRVYGQLLQWWPGILHSSGVVGLNPLSRCLPDHWPAHAAMLPCCLQGDLDRAVPLAAGQALADAFKKRGPGGWPA
jgi:hypothetical protein